MSSEERELVVHGGELTVSRSRGMHAPRLRTVRAETRRLPYQEEMLIGRVGPLGRGLAELEKQGRLLLKFPPVKERFPFPY